MRVCIVGSGVYGSYVARVVSESFPNARIVVLEAGDWHPRDEVSAGFRTVVHGGHYAALATGRFFGVGGSSTRWGGQLFTFGRQDFADPAPFLRDIVELNLAHRQTVLRRLSLVDQEGDRVEDGLLVKTGIWLGYFRRNLFRALRIVSLKNVEVRIGCRVTRLACDGKRITGLSVHDGSEERTEQFDQYFLCAGAFESNRLLLASGMNTERRFRFSDHLSQRAFRISGGTRVGETDFGFRFRGSSLVTKRLVGEVGGVSFFAHPIFNDRFPFFQLLKQVLFQRRFALGTLLALVISLPQAIVFFFHMFVLRRLYVHRGEWDLQLDLENYHSSGDATLCAEVDSLGQPALKVEFAVDARTDDLFAAARAQVRSHLQKSGVAFEELRTETALNKYEDTYHPYGMFASDSASAKEYFERFDNMLVVNTGVLPRAGGINCTAAVFPLIEEYVSQQAARTAKTM